MLVPFDSHVKPIDGHRCIHDQLSSCELASSSRSRPSLCRLNRIPRRPSFPAFAHPIPRSTARSSHDPVTPLDPTRLSHALTTTVVPLLPPVLAALHCPSHPSLTSRRRPPRPRPPPPLPYSAWPLSCSGHEQAPRLPVAQSRFAPDTNLLTRG